MYQRQVPFSEAAMRGFVKNYCNFTGRASRSEFWWFMLFYAIINVLTGVCCGGYGSDGSNWGEGIIGLVFLLPSLGVSVRRLHDTGRSGWWVLLSLIPIVGNIILIIWYAQASQPGLNLYGPEPNMVD